VQLTLTRKHAGLALLALAALGVPLATFDTGCTWQTKDPATGLWRDASPTEMTGFANDTGAIFRTAIQGTPLAPILPWADAVIRLLALLAAWRVIPTPKAANTPAAKTTAALPGAAP
jgi:hypothetical protein